MRPTAKIVKNLNQRKSRMNVTIKNQLKDVNSVNQTRLIIIAVRIAPVCVLLGWVIGGLQGALYGLTVSVFAVFAVELLADGIGNGSVNILYGTGRLDRTMRDQFIGALSQARFHKMSGRHDLALDCVNEVLAAAPNYTEALFLKAQILWEGYRDSAAAKNCLLHVIKVEPDKEAPFHRWALSLYREIAGCERDQNRLLYNKQ
jgi:hypothetical protein